jgi:hypothetical protein
MWSCAHAREGSAFIDTGLLEHGLEVRLRGLQSSMVRRLSNRVPLVVRHQCSSATTPEHWWKTTGGTRKRPPMPLARLLGLEVRPEYHVECLPG